MRVAVLGPIVAAIAVLPPLRAQQPDVLFQAPQVVLPLDSPPFQKLFDADGDGDPDAVGTRVRSDGLVEVRFWRNDQGTFTAVANVSAPVYGAGGYGRDPVFKVAIGDLDADGDQDVVLGGGWEVLRCRNDGGFQFTLSATSHTNHVRDLAVGDFDADGYADVATLVGSIASYPIYLQVATQTLTVQTSSIYFPLDAARLLVLDLDGDPAAELGVAYTAIMRCFDLQGGALVQLPDLQDPTIVRPAMWTGGDVDGDGDTDVVVFEMPGSSSQPARVHCVRRNGPTNWSVDAAYAGGPAEYLADIDLDGDPDGVCCGGGSGGGTPTWPTIDFASTFEVALNQGNGVFAPAFAFPGLGSRSLAGARDVDGDGDVDLVAGACVFHGRGPWTGHPMPPVQTNGFVDIQPDLLADYDRDGDVDVARWVLGGAENRGAGVFVPRNLLFLDPGPALPAGTLLAGGGFVGDFDGDGAPDEVWPLFAAGNPHPFVQMAFLRNNGSGVLTYAGQPTGNGVRMGRGWSFEQTDVADLDGDGDLDAIGNCDPFREPRHCELFYNDGNGAFTPGPTFAGECFEHAGDFDGDGIVDLLLTDDANRVPLLRLGIASPGAPFGAPMLVFGTTPVSNFVHTVTAADATGDGRLDVLVVAAVTGELHLWANVTAAPGAPQFLRADPAGWPRLFGSRPRIRVGDFDGDGNPDLVVGRVEQSTDVAAVYRRLPGQGVSLAPSSYAPPVRQLLGIGFPADGDGDGDLDLLGERLWRNSRWHGDAAGVIAQFGAATPGEAGVAPLLGGRGPARVGVVKNLQLRGITGPTAGLLAVGFRRADLPDFPLPGVRCLVDPSALLLMSFQVASSGQGRAASAVDLPVYLPPVTLGLDFAEQMFVLDPAAPSGVAASNGLFVHVGG